MTNIKTLDGDLLNINEGIIIHQVNCLGLMGSGVALGLSQKYPKIKSEYLKKCKGKLPEELLGQYQFVNVSDKLSIVNSFTQLNAGFGQKQTDEDKLIHNIQEICQENHDQDVYIPHLIGCGLAGGNWDRVLDGIKHLTNLTVVQLSDYEKRRRGLII